MHLMTRHLVALLICASLAGAARGQGEPKFLRKTAEEWAARLQSKDPAVRRTAAFALGKMGNRAAATIFDLKKALREENDARVREALAGAVGEVASVSLQGGGDFDLERLLVTTAKDPDTLVRRSAVCSLGRLANKTDATRDALVKALGDPAAEVRQNAAWALGQLGEPAVAPLRRALADADSLVKRDAAGALSQVAQDKPDVVRPALGELLGLCRDANVETRKAGLIVLVKIVTPKDAAAAPVLKTALADPNVEVQRYAALALSNIGGQEASAAVPVLLETLRRGDLDLQRAAAIALHNIGAAASGATDDLVKALDAPDPELRRYAALALGGIGPTADRAVTRLAELVASGDEPLETRIEAAEALTRMGDAAPLRAEVPRLLGVLGDARVSGLLRVRLAWMFNSLVNHPASMEAAYPVFAKVCAEPGNKENGSARYHSAYLLGLMRKEKTPDPALDVLGEWLRDDSGRFYLNKQSSVGATGTEATGQSTVREVLQGDSRSMAVQALRFIGADRFARRPDIVRQLRVLAADQKLNKELRGEVNKLLKTVQ
jgi:HEAT repeat protein